MANEHSIRVSARGEFGQLENGLKNLQKDLKSVLGEIDKGARRGGLFDDTQLRALDVYRSRFKQSMDEVNRELQKQNDTIEQLHRRRENSSRSEQRAIDDEIRRREKALDVLRRQIRAVEDLSQKRGKEAEGYGRAPGSSAGVSSSSGVSAGSGLMGGAMAKALGMGKFMVGLAGIGGIASMAQQAYSLALQSQTAPMNLSQRIRGYGYNGSAKNMWDDIGNIGRNSSMGYTSQESWGFMDAYSRQAGTMNRQDLESSLMFGRGYGLEAGETAGALASVRELGGTTSAVQFANMIASSVSQSGMTPRILEVMETSAGLLEQMNTSLKDGGSHQLLAYQTVLDKIGNDKGMMRLTGQSGANIIGGIGGIFNPSQENPWKWMGIQALQQYKPGKYGNMGLYDLETNFESGLENTDNVGAMAQYLRGKSGGDENMMKRMLQRWLQDGGYNATKQQVNDLYTATDGFTAFDSEKVNGVMSTLEGGDATAKYQERMGQLGQDILDTNARFEKQLENLGQPLVTLVQGIKEGVTSLLEELQTNDLEQQIKVVLDDIKKFMEDNLMGLATAAGLVALAPAIAKALGGDGNGGGKSKGSSPSIVPIVGAASLITPLLLPLILAGGAIMGGKWLQSEGADKFFKTMFPPEPKSKEEKEAFEKAADPENKEMQWYEWFNPTKWDKIKWKDIFDWGSTEPAKELAKKNGIDPTEAYELLKQLGSSGLVSINGMTEIGKQKLQELADQGLIKLTEGQALQSTSMTAFTEKGRTELQKLADLGLISISGFEADGKAKITVMSESGKAALEALNKDGSISIGDFKTENTKVITGMTTEGSKQLLKLQENGSLSMDGMDKTTDDKLELVRKKTETKLGDIHKEHTTFKDKTVGKDGIFEAMKKAWEDFIQFWKDLMPSWLGGGDSNVGNSPGGGSGMWGGQKFDGKYDDIINKYAKQNGLDPLLVASVISKESNFNAGATSHAGAMGLMQLMPGTARGLGVSNAYDPEQNVMGGSKYLAQLIQKYDGNLENALMAYNWGAGNVDAYLKTGRGAKGQARPKESQEYVGKIMSQYQAYMSAMGGGGSSFFDGWQKRITSHFGSKEGFRSSPHRGLDINGEQGDALQAVQGGTVAFLNYDDGSKKDKDGKANTRGGGTELGIRMPNGQIYFYSHMSNVNSSLKVGSQVAAGQWVGNVGGDRGMPGSGSSTTGSHLHLGLMDAKGNLKDPEGWLKGMNAGDSDIGTLLGAGGGAVVNGTTVKDITVTVKFEGDGAEKLNAVTESTLQKLVTQAIQNYEAQKLLLNPSM